ncbi:hypothetical protein Holit_01758 [Hollandina sp. SP2]
MNITRLRQFFFKYRNPVPGVKEAINPEKKGVLPLPNQIRSESPRHTFQGFWSRFPLRVQYVKPKPSLTPEEFLQKYREEYRRQEAQKPAEGTDQEPLNSPMPNMDRFFDDIAKIYHYRRPWIPQVRDYKKHPILARIFWFFWSLSYSFDPPWSHIRIIITHKKT